MTVDLALRGDMKTKRNNTNQSLKKTTKHWRKVRNKFLPALLAATLLAGTMSYAVFASDIDSGIPSGDFEETINAPALTDSKSVDGYTSQDEMAAAEAAFAVPEEPAPEDTSAVPEEATPEDTFSVSEEARDDTFADLDEGPLDNTLDAGEGVYPLPEDNLSEEFSGIPVEVEGQNQETQVFEEAPVFVDENEGIGQEAVAEEAVAAEGAGEGSDDNTTAEEIVSTDATEDIGESTPDIPVPATGTVVRGFGKCQSYVPAESGAQNGNNDDIFAAYVNRELGLAGNLRADTGDYMVTEPARYSHFAGSSLRGINRSVYGKLLESVRDVADGYCGNSYFYISPDSIGADKLSWTAEDLGVESLVEYSEEDDCYYLTEDVSDAATAALGIDMSLLCEALLADCPYDLYWFDKTLGCTYEDIPFSAFYDGYDWILQVDGDIWFTFYVAPEYSTSGTAGTTEVNASIGTAVNTAKEKAAEIVDTYEYCSDYEKLDAYRYEIQELSGYNHPAADDESIPYGNPWQLIWVFDGDPDTTVVCEGFSKAFQYLCDMTDFNDGIVQDCLSIGGEAFGGGHMWNLVVLTDGKSYLADITNCEQYYPGENDAPELFLVGVKNQDGLETEGDGLATGSALAGYTFDNTFSYDTYVYDAGTLETFPEQRLTLAEGRMTSDTRVNTPSPVSSIERHSHIYVVDPEIKSDCEFHGWSAGSHCAVCGKVNVEQKQLPLAAHQFTAWKTTRKATYVQTGLQKRSCSVCGKEETRTLQKLPRTSIAKGNVSGIKAKVYSGKAQVQAPVLKVNGRALKKGTDYTISYKNNKNVGTAYCIFTGKGAYTGTLKKAFPINPRPASIKSISSASGKLTVRWTKQAVQTTGYQIQYSSRKNFSSNKFVTLAKPSATSAVIKKLARNRIYYIRIRTYKVVAGKKYYSSFSAVKTKRTKK